MSDEESAAYELQDEFEAMAKGFGRGKYGRIMKMAHTPSKDEYVKTLYITAIGMVLIGAVGFAIWWVMTVLPEYFRGNRMASISGESPFRKAHAGAVVSWPFTVSSEQNKVKISITVVTGPDSDAPDWDISLIESARGEVWNNYRGTSGVTVDTPGSRPKELQVSLTCPKGARYGDTAEVVVTADDGVSSSLKFSAVAIQSLMILKTQMDQEVVVAEDVVSKTKVAPQDVYAVLSPMGLRGFLIVEGMNTDRLREKTRGIKKARNFLDGETSMDEIRKYLVPVSAVKDFGEGDIIELVKGPFKGEKARISHIDRAKEEITVELIEAMVPIPVTVKGDSVRIIEKEK